MEHFFFCRKYFLLQNYKSYNDDTYLLLFCVHVFDVYMQNDFNMNQFLKLTNLGE